MSALPRKPHVEIDDDNTTMPPPAEENGDPDSRQDQEDSLVALIEHRTQEVEHNRRKRQYYQSKLEEAEKRLKESQTKLARLRSQNKSDSSKAPPSSGTKSVKEERRSTSPVPLRSQPQSRTELLIPAVAPRVIQPPKVAGSSGRGQVSSSSQASASVSSQSNSAGKEKGDKSYRSLSKQDVEVQDRGTKRKFEEREHIELIPMVRGSSKPSIIQCHTNNHISSHHKRKLRCLYSCPVNDQLFATSALDGLVNFWEVQGRG